MATARPDLAALLDDPNQRAAAAMALGRLGAREYGSRIAPALPNLTGLEYVALELLGDPAVVPALLPHAGDWDVHHALTRLTGRDPLVASWWQRRIVDRGEEDGDEDEPELAMWPVSCSSRGWRTAGPTR